MKSAPAPQTKSTGPYTALCVTGMVICFVAALGVVAMKLISPSLFPGHVDALLILTPTGGILIFAGLMLVDINTQRSKDFLISSQSSRRVVTQSRRLALACNGFIVLLGLAMALAGLAIYLHGPLG